MSGHGTQDPRTLIVSPATLAVIVSLTERRLAQLAAEGMPKSGRDGYPLADAVQWIITYWRTRAVQSPLTSARRRKIEADAEVSEMELAKLRGALMDPAILYRAHGEACARLRTRLLAIPSRLAPALVRIKSPAQAAEAIRSVVVEALEELTSGTPTPPPNSAGRPAARAGRLPRGRKGNPAAPGKADAE